MISVRGGAEDLGLDVNGIGLRIEPDSGVIANCAAGAPGVGDGVGVPGEISAYAGDGDGQALRAARSREIVCAPAGIDVIDVEGVSVITAQRRAIDDIEGI